MSRFKAGNTGMALGIYKSGQGYWVRALSAVAFGVLTLATAAWVWGETAAITLPTSSWTMSLENATGTVAPGETLTGLRESETTGELVEVGTIQVKAFMPGEFAPKVSLENPALNAGVVPSDLQGLRAEGFDAGIGSVLTIPVVDQLYLQGAAAGLVLLIGAVLIFFFIGSKPSSCEFLIATDGEMKKVNWSTRREVLGSTWVVIAASFLIAWMLYLVDMAFQTFFVAINVLQR
ncbi:MAG: preprotein translocase subunit SecE [Phycisphaerales bacterium JB041]